MADSTPQTTGRITRRSARLSSKTPQVQCVGTDLPAAKTRAGQAPDPTPRAALFDISNSDKEESFAATDPHKQCKEASITEMSDKPMQPASLEVAMDAAARSAKHEPEQPAEADLLIPGDKEEEVVQQERVVEGKSELSEPEAVHVHDAKPDCAPAPGVFSKEARARHKFAEVIAKLMPLHTRDEGLEELYRFTKSFPDYDINKYLSKTKESFRNFIHNGMEEIAAREAEKEEEPAVEAKGAARAHGEAKELDMETQSEDLLSDQIEHVNVEDAGQLQLDASSSEQMAYNVGLVSPEMPRAPPTTPNPFFVEDDEEILVDFNTTPIDEERPDVVPEPVVDPCPDAESTPAAMEASKDAPKSEAGSDGGFRWLMVSPSDGSTPSQWASNIPPATDMQSPGTEASAELLLPGEQVPPPTVKSKVVIPEASGSPWENNVDAPVSSDLLAARIRAEHPRNWRRFVTTAEGHNDDEEEEEEEEAVEWDVMGEDSETDCVCDDDDSAEIQQADGLAEMLGDMAISQKAAMQGLPLAQGKHTRFLDDGSAVVSPSSRVVPLKGVPQPKGKHTYFD